MHGEGKGGAYTSSFPGGKGPGNEDGAYNREKKAFCDAENYFTLSTQDVLVLKIGFHFKNVKVSKTKEKEGERRKKGAYIGVGGWGGGERA